jgi:hypothetical protein
VNASLTAQPTDDSIYPRATQATPATYRNKELELSVLVNDREFFTASEIANEVGVVRQTLWRWRLNGKIPQGHLFRDRQILFTAEEREQIREYANKLEPANADMTHKVATRS